MSKVFTEKQIIQKFIRALQKSKPLATKHLQKELRDKIRTAPKHELKRLAEHIRGRYKDAIFAGEKYW